MSEYIKLEMNYNIYREIINDLMEYCTSLNEYWEIESCIHLIDYLNTEFDRSKSKENQDLKKWQKYEKLFKERFNNPKYKNEEGNINTKGVHEYKNFHKVNKVLESHLGDLNIIDEKQQFCLILDLIHAMEDCE